MANFPIDENQETLELELRKIETSDPVHADIYNALFQKLINNDAFLERLADKMIRQAMISHVLDSNNAGMVLGADVGPKITTITDGLQRALDVLNTKSAGHPDYANAVSIFKSNVVSNTSYTVPFDGILTLVASSISSTGSVSASVNGVTIANWRDNGASSSSSSTGANVFTVPVKNGDIVVLGASNNAFFTTSSRLVPYS